MKGINLLLFVILLFPCFSYGGAKSDSGSSQQKFYSQTKVGLIGENDVYETPYYTMVGKKSSPVMILDGGIHGDEVAAFIACDSIVKYINILEGTLVVIPRVNIQACRNDTRFINFDFNHAFPGDLQSDIYEYRLAYEFMWLVDSIEPDLIINLHEARTKYNGDAATDDERAYGQIVISCIQPFQEMMLKSIDDMDAKIPVDDFKFHPHYYEFHDYSSMDNFISKFNITSYTVETWRGFNVDDRVKLQIIASLQFMQELGIKFEYPDVKFQ